MVVARWKQWERTKRSTGAPIPAQKMEEACKVLAENLGVKTTDLRMLLNENRRKYRRIEAAVVATIAQIKKEG